MCQCVVLEGTFLGWLPIPSRVPQGSILGPLLLLVFASDLPDNAESGSTLALYADDSKLYRTHGSSDSNTHLQQDQLCLRKLSLDNSMAFNASKYEFFQENSSQLCSYVQPGQTAAHVCTYWMRLSMIS